MVTLGTKGQQIDFLIRQGATFGPYEFQLLNPDQSPINISDITLSGNVRKSYLDSTASAEFVITKNFPLEGRFVVSIPHTVTALLPCGEKETLPESKYVWDIEGSSNGVVFPILYGKIKVFREITK